MTSSPSSETSPGPAAASQPLPPDATLVDLGDYTGEALFFERNGRGTMGEGYWHNAEELLLDALDARLPMPEWAFACNPIVPMGDADEHIELTLERSEVPSHMKDHVTADQHAMLQTFLDAWWKNLRLNCVMVDRTRVVRLPLGARLSAQAKHSLHEQARLRVLRELQADAGEGTSYEPNGL